MSTVLAIDTCTEACSAALCINGETIQRYEIAPRKHGELILPMVQSLMEEAGINAAMLDALAFGRGPGAFTGIRIGVSVAQGIALGADVPVVPVSNLAALAQGCMRATGQNQIAAVFDARMSEVYYGAYVAESGAMVLLDRELVCSPSNLNSLGSQWFGSGSGWITYADELGQTLEITEFETQRFPQSQDIAYLGTFAFERGEALAAELAQPVYLRDQVAVKTADRKANNATR